MRSPCKRSSGNASRQSDAPRSRNDTATFASRLSSPSIHHSKPRLISVAGSTTSSPGVTAFVACRAPPVGLCAAALAATSISSSVSARASGVVDIAALPTIRAAAPCLDLGSLPIDERSAPDPRLREDHGIRDRNLVVELGAIGGELEALDDVTLLALCRAEVAVAVIVDATRLDDELVASDSPHRRALQRGSARARRRLEIDGAREIVRLAANRKLLITRIDDLHRIRAHHRVRHARDFAVADGLLARLVARLQTLAFGGQFRRAARSWESRDQRRPNAKERARAAVRQLEIARDEEVGRVA